MYQLKGKQIKFVNFFLQFSVHFQLDSNNSVDISHFVYSIFPIFIFSYAYIFNNYRKLFKKNTLKWSL